MSWPISLPKLIIQVLFLAPLKTWTFRCVYEERVVYAYLFSYVIMTKHFTRRRVHPPKAGGKRSLLSVRYTGGKVRVMLCDMSSLHVIRMSPVRRTYVTGTSKLHNMSTWLSSRPAQNHRQNKKKYIWGPVTRSFWGNLWTQFILLILFSMYELKHLYTYLSCICSMARTHVSDGITI